jgi:hypothetical protein
MADARSLATLQQAVHRRWREVALSISPIDKARARRAVEALYETVTGRPPLYVLFFASPLEAELAGGFFAGDYPRQPLRLPAGPRLRPLMRKSIARMREPFFDRVVGRALAWHDQVRDAVDAPEIADRPLRLERVFRVLTGQLPPLVSRQLISPGWRRKEGRKDPHGNIEQLVGLGDWISAAAHHDYHRAAFPHRREHGGDEPLMAAVKEVCKTCGWCAFHHDIAFVTDRPAMLQFDAAGRLHAESGHALVYRDGFSIHALRGARVPRRVIERPDRITVADVENQPDLPARRALLERMGYQRYFAQSGAESIAHDACGTLWRRALPSIGHVRREWRFVEVINGTPENGAYRHYYLQVPLTTRTAQQAVAWTYGLPASEYQPLIRT